MSSHSLPQHFLTEAYNNAWANHRLLRACCALTPDEFAARRTSFFPSIKATLNHILTVDWFYVELLESAMTGAPHPGDPRRHFAVAEPFDDCAALSREQHASDRRLIELCGRLSDADLDRVVILPRRTGPERDRMGRILAHVFQHQIHHRGQAHAMLAGTAMPPPPLDEFYCTGESNLRAQDFAELGFDETTIWGDRASPP